MAYYFVEDIELLETTLIVVQILKACSEYFPVPTTVDGDELRQKLKNLYKLHTLWTEYNYSYQSEVYKQICNMFSKNIFRCLPLSYNHEDEINAEMMWEFRQLYPVYNVFTAFLNLKSFEEEKLVPYVNKQFIEMLMQRLDSCIEAERDCVKQILFKLFYKAIYLREYIIQGTINLLAEYENDIISINNGIKELLELFKTFMLQKLIESPIIAKVLPPLIKRNDLCDYSAEDLLYECFETAARVVDANLPSLFVDYAIDNWRVAAADEPSLCRTLSALYFDVCGPHSKRRARDRVVGHVTECLMTAVGPNSVAARNEYVEFCGRLIDERVCGDDVATMRRVTKALVDAYRNHSYHGRVDCADRLDDRRWRRTISGRPRLLAGGHRDFDIVDRLRTMIENLIDNAF